jgi:hypothetical protein
MLLILLLAAGCQGSSSSGPDGGGTDGDSDMDTDSDTDSDTDTDTGSDTDTGPYVDPNWSVHTIEGIVGVRAPLTVADFDGDTHLDVTAVVASSPWDSLILYLNESGDWSTFTELMIIESFDFFVSTGAEDLDQDGDLDLLVGSDNQASWFENTAGDGSEWSHHGLATCDEWLWFRVAAADVDGDAIPDLVAGNGEYLYWYENANGDASNWIEHDTGCPWLWGNFVQPSDLDPCDMDGDDDIDVLVSQGTDTSYYLWMENTAGDGSAWTTHLIGNTDWEGLLMSADDLDGDGDLDFAGMVASPVYGSEPHEFKTLWFENTSGDGIEWADHQLLGQSETYGRVAVADVDGDGDTDVICSREMGIMWFDNADGDGQTWNEQTVTTGSQGANPLIPIDMDGDDDLDLVTASGSKVTWFENLYE